MLSDFDLIELLSAKMCHDLAGPIGAVNNGVELLMEDKCSIKDRAASLIETSAKEAVIRLQFFRQLYGTVPTMGEANLDHLKNLTASFFKESKINLDWPDVHTNASEIAISHKLGKIILNSIFISSGILIHGGKISVRLQKLANGKRIIVSCNGTGLKVDEFLLAIADGKLEQQIITSRNVQMYYTFKFAKATSIHLVMEQKNETVEFTIDQLRS
jgi:histidine phosphotransferase ChpT